MIWKVCQTTDSGTSAKDLGRQDNTTIEFQYGQGHLAIIYTANDQATLVYRSLVT